MIVERMCCPAWNPIVKTLQQKKPAVMNVYTLYQYTTDYLEYIGYMSTTNLFFWWYHLFKKLWMNLRSSGEASTWTDVIEIRRESHYMLYLVPFLTGIAILVAKINEQKTQIFEFSRLCILKEETMRKKRRSSNFPALGSWRKKLWAKNADFRIFLL